MSTFEAKKDFTSELQVSPISARKYLGDELIVLYENYRRSYRNLSRSQMKRVLMRLLPIFLH